MRLYIAGPMTGYPDLTCLIASSDERIDALEFGIEVQRAQVRMCGNSVCPPLAAALAKANVAHESAWRVAA